jgi:hypothetical protein
MILKTKCGSTFKLGKGKPLSDVPKTYRQVKIVSFPYLGGLYNSGLCTIYRTQRGMLMYKVYRDGCIYPFYGTLTPM